MNENDKIYETGGKYVGKLDIQKIEKDQKKEQTQLALTNKFSMSYKVRTSTFTGFEGASTGLNLNS